MQRDTFVGAWQRRRDVFDRSLAVLLTGVSSSDTPFARCEEEISYCRKLTNVMVNVAVTIIPAEVDFALRYFARSCTKRYLFHGVQLRICVTEA